MEHVGHLAPRTGTMEARPHCGGKPTSLTELSEVAKNPGNSGFLVTTTDGTVPSGMAQKLSDLPCKRERKAGAVQVDVVADCTHHGCNLITSVTCLRCWWCVGQSCCVCWTRRGSKPGCGTRVSCVEVVFVVNRVEEEVRVRLSHMLSHVISRIGLLCSFIRCA